MVIDDLYVKGIAVLPAKYNSELLINPDRVFSLVVSLQCLQAIARRHTKILKRCCIM